MIEAASVSYGEIDLKLRLALSDLRQNDHQLLEREAHEIAITHQIACYFKKYFHIWHVDCEYNRRGNDAKTNSAGQDIRPDIIIHERHDPKNPSKKNNLLIIEVKKNKTDSQNDRDKLIELTKKDGADHYQFGVFLSISTIPPYHARWELFQNGIHEKTIVE